MPRRQNMSKMFSLVPTTRNSSTTHRSRRTMRKKWTVTWFWSCAVACLTVVIVRSRRILNSLLSLSYGVLSYLPVLILQSSSFLVSLSTAFLEGFCQIYESKVSVIKVNFLGMLQGFGSKERFTFFSFMYCLLFQSLLNCVANKVTKINYSI